MSDVATIRLLRYPLRLYVRSREHFDELLREFQLLDLGATSGTASRPLPQRLADMVHEVTTRYKARVDELDGLRNAALADGQVSMELVYELPVDARQAAVDLAALLEECDTYCRNGKHLLTLATPPDLAEFRRWNLDEVVRQIDGGQPTAWPGEI